MSEYPNLKGVATKDLVDSVQAGSFKADYINWSRTMQLLRDHAPGWLPTLVGTEDGVVVHPSPGVGGFLMIAFKHQDGAATPGVPQAIMDNRNAAIPLDKITARDITDTHRRGICAAAALTFGLAYELWAKMPLESGYTDPQPAAPPEPEPHVNLAPLQEALGRLAQLDTVTDWDAGVDRAARKDFGRPIQQLKQGEVDKIVARLVKHADTLEKALKHADTLEKALAEQKSAGASPTGAAGTSPPAGAAPADTDSPAEPPTGTGSPDTKEATGAAGEQSQFKIPAGPRGSRRKEAA